MTTLLYQTDSYLREFSARVIQLIPEESAIILDQTTFYPGGGGQVYDTGCIKHNGISSSIKRAKNSGHGILHIISEGDPIPEVGTEVIGILDWDRRIR